MKRKILFFALALVMILALVPVSAASTDFIKGDIAVINKLGYDSFKGKEVTANNSFGYFDFVADNKILNAWYIDVSKDIKGTLEVAYKIGNNYYVVAFEINGAGKYWIADSKGSNGANMAKIGEFVEAGNKEPVSSISICYQGFSNSPQTMDNDEFDALVEELKEEGITPLILSLSNGWEQDDYSVVYSLYADEKVEFEVPTYYEFEYKGIRYAVELDVVQLEILNPVTERGRLFSEGEINKDYTSVVDDITRTINVGASFTVEKVDGYDDYYTYFAYVHSALIKLGPAVHVHDFVTIWNNELCFEGRWEVTITCTSCDYNYHAHGFPQDHIDAILEADDNGSDFWYCPICGTSGSKNIWIIP